MGLTFLMKVIDPFNNRYILVTRLREILDNIMESEESIIYTDSICKYFKR